jgi:hypothetical protein
VIPGDRDFARPLDSLKHLKPKHEVRLAVGRGDRRYLALESGGILGVPDSVAAEAFRLSSFRRIRWTADFSTGKQHERWQALAASYTARYNAELWRLSRHN